MVQVLAGLVCVSLAWLVTAGPRTARQAEQVEGEEGETPQPDQFSLFGQVFTSFSEFHARLIHFIL